MSSPLHIAYIDESSTPSPADGTPYFVVAALVTESSRPIINLIKRTRRALGRRARASELKASKSAPGVIFRLLKKFVKESCDIYVVIVDKSASSGFDAEEVYRAAVGRVVLHCVREHPNLHIYLDKRYTNRHQRLALEKTIRKFIAEIPDQVVIIEQVDSTAHPGLQAVDFIAWAFAKKTIHNQKDAAEILIPRTRVAEVLTIKKLAAPPGGR